MFGNHDFKKNNQYKLFFSNWEVATTFLYLTDKDKTLDHGIKGKIYWQQLRSVKQNYIFFLVDYNDCV